MGGDRLLNIGVLLKKNVDQVLTDVRVLHILILGLHILEGVECLSEASQDLVGHVAVFRSIILLINWV